MGYFSLKATSPETLSETACALLQHWLDSNKVQTPTETLFAPKPALILFYLHLTGSSGQQVFPASLAGIMFGTRQRQKCGRGEAHATGRKRKA